MDAPPTTSAFAPVSALHPHGAAYWITHPRKFVRSLGHAPVAVRVDPRGRDAWGPDATWWTLDRRRLGDRIAITFATEDAIRRLDARWRIVADAIRELARRRAELVCHDFPLDLNDGVHAGTPSHVHAFARPPGCAAKLVPNPYLLRPRPWLLPPLPWEWKTDMLYFRGGSTGSFDYECNTRVALCRLARSLPRADCKLSRTRHHDPEFTRRLVAEGLVGRRHALDALSRHRFLVDVDGHVSSWDRFMLIGTCGGVPLRFETAWEECWHHRLVDGRHCVQVDRHSLPGMLERLRSDDAEARRIAVEARTFVREHLSRTALHEVLADRLAAHEAGR
jgi:hypothetical protein